MKIHNPLKNKKFKYGSLSVVFTVVFIAIVIMINIAAELLLERFGAKIDLTENRLYSIEEMTKNYLNDLTDNVTVTVASRETDFTGMNSVYMQTNEIIKRFAETSPYVTVNYIDLLSNPAFAGKYENLSATSILVESSATGRYRIINENEYLSFEYYDYLGNQITASEYSVYSAYGMAFMDVSAAAENALLSAFLSVTDVNPVYVGVSGGYGETQNDELGSLLQTNAYILSTVNLTTDEISDKYDFLIINSPDADFNGESLSKLDKWLDNGGKFGKTLIYVSPYNIETPNIDSFLRDWGVEIERSVVEQFDSEHASFVGMQLIQQFKPEDTDYAKNLNQNYSVYASFMRTVDILPSHPSNVEIRPLITSFEGAVRRPFEEMSNDDWIAPASDKGVFNIAAESSKIRYDGSVRYASNVIVFGGYVILDDYFLKMKNANNADFFINMMNYLSGKENIVKISPKSFSVSSFNISAGTSGVIGFIFAVALPVVIVVIGVVIWLRRRYK